jgi:hydantoinase/carbamoylase family amidase
LAGEEISSTRLARTIGDFAAFGAESKGGVSRFAFTEAEIGARRYLVNAMRGIGLEVRVDRIGNLIGRRRSKSKLPAIGFGSHVDTVPHGGRFDGVAGVAAGLEVMRVLQETKWENVRPLELIVFSAEEGSRFPFQLGSKVMAGLVPIRTAYTFKDSRGVKVGDLMHPILRGLKLVPTSWSKDHFHAWLELHVEQGPILEANNLDVGVVTQIVGLEVILVRFIGKSGHAGTVPMNLRNDSMIGAVKAISEIRELARSVSLTAVATVGSIKVHPGAFNTIPELVEFTVDFRDVKSQNIKKLVQEIERIVRRIALENHLNSFLKRLAFSEPVKMDKSIVRLLEEEARAAGLAYRRMHSGAGHDTQNMTKIARSGMIFVPSKSGSSHVPKEFTYPEQLARGTELMLQAVKRLARQVSG